MIQTANEAWRDDLERREEWRQALENRAKAVSKAYEYIVLASEAINQAGPVIPEPGGDKIYDRVACAIWDARRKTERDLKMITDPPTETYLGNKAAFGRPYERTDESLT